MLEALTHSLDIALGDGVIAASRRPPWPRARPTLLALQEAPRGMAESALLERLDALLAQNPVPFKKAHVLVHDGLVRYWECAPPLNAASLEDCAAAVRMRFQAVYDESPDDWLLQGDLRSRAPFMACACRPTLVHELAQVLRRHGLVMMSLVPEMMAIWNFWCARMAPGSWLLVVTGGGLKLGVPEQGGLARMRTLALPAGVPVTTADVMDFVRHTSQKLNVPMPARIASCGKVPSALRGLVSGVEWTPLGMQADVLGLLRGNH